MERLSAERFLAEVEGENICAIESNAGQLILLADVEVWQDINWENGEDHSDDPYRVEVFAKGNWQLDADILMSAGLSRATVQDMKINLQSNVLWKAVDEARGRNCGGISFLHEEDRTEKSVKDAFLLHLNYWDNEDIPIFRLSDEELSGICDILADGIYIFCC